MKYKANRPLTGDYGPAGQSMTVQPGQVFEVPDHQVRKFVGLESKGIIQRYREPRPVKAFTAYQNKAIVPQANKRVV